MHSKFFEPTCNVNVDALEAFINRNGEVDLIDASNNVPNTIFGELLYGHMQSIFLAPALSVSEKLEKTLVDRNSVV